LGDLVIRPLRADETDKFVALSYYAFDGRTPDQRAADFGRRVIPERNCLVAEEDGQIVSQAMIYDLPIWIDGARYPSGGLANVATVPERTRRGYARQLVTATLGWMRNELGFCLSTLFPTMFPLYSGLGWALTDDSIRHSGPVTAFRPSRLLPADPGSRMVRRPVQSEDIDVLEPIYHAFAQSRSGYVERPRWYWEDYVLPQRAERPRWLGLWYGGDGLLAGYVVYTLERAPERHLQVYEVVALRPEAYHGILTFLSTHHLWDKIVLPAGRDVPWRLMIDNPQLITSEVQDSQYFMVRIVDVAKALALRPVRSATPNSRLVLTVRDAWAPWNNGTWAVGQRDGRWAAEPAPGANADASGDVAALSALFAGFLSVPQAIDLGGLQASAAARPTLEALFATTYPPTSRDHF
jgi:predicted acetyltransferase